MLNEWKKNLIPEQSLVKRRKYFCHMKKIRHQKFQLRPSGWRICFLQHDKTCIFKGHQWKHNNFLKSDKLLTSKLAYLLSCRWNVVLLTLFAIRAIKVNVTAFTNWPSIRRDANAAILTRIVMFTCINSAGSNTLQKIRKSHFEKWVG